MISFFANIFGYILNFIYELIKNYGFAIIIFSILLKLALLPLTIKQQNTLKKSQKLQKELKIIQERYKNDPEKLNQEMMALYKRENMSPFSGCLSSIIQLVLLISMFYLVRNPLTYMKKVDSETINLYKKRIVYELGENSLTSGYPEISIVKFINKKIDNNETVTNEENIIEENVIDDSLQINSNDEQLIDDENEEDTESHELIIDKDLYINMNFLGLDLSSIPKENYNDIKVFIIPILYIISSFISIKLTQIQTNQSKNEEELKSSEQEEKTEQEDMTAQMSKSMTWMMPILAVSISVIAPLGLALYWLVNNVLMIIERVVIDKIIATKEEDKND